MTRDELIRLAAKLNNDYRVGDKTPDDLEIGFLYGTAELILAATWEDGASYSELREHIAHQIDELAAVDSYSVFMRAYRKPSLEQENIL